MDKEMDELRRACAQLLGQDPETWPTHGNAPLAIASALALALRPSPPAPLGGLTEAFDDACIEHQHANRDRELSVTWRGYSHQDREAVLRDFARRIIAPLGGLTEGEVAAWMYQWFGGAANEAYSLSLTRNPRIRVGVNYCTAIIPLYRRLTAPRAEGVDFPSDATLARVSQEVDQSQFTPLEQWDDPTAIGMGERAPRPAALTAAAPKVDGMVEFVRNAPRTYRDTPEPPDAFSREEAAAPRAEGVDACPHEAWEDNGGARHCADCREYLGSTAALTAAAPKVGGDWLDEMVDRRAPEVRAKMEQRVNELRVEAAAPQAVAWMLASPHGPAFAYAKQPEHWHGRGQPLYAHPAPALVVAQPAAQGGDGWRELRSPEEIAAAFAAGEYVEVCDPVYRVPDTWVPADAGNPDYIRAARIAQGYRYRAALAPQRKEDGNG